MAPSEDTTQTRGSEDLESKVEGSDSDSPETSTDEDLHLDDEGAVTACADKWEEGENDEYSVSVVLPRITEVGPILTGCGHAVQAFRSTVVRVLSLTIPKKG